MTQKWDARSRRTQIQIRNAFMALLMEEGFDRITVSALVKRAQINRATFYRHYTDIYDLAYRLTDILFLDINEQLTGGAGNQTDAEGASRLLVNETDLDRWALLFVHVAEHADFYRAMIKPRGIPGFRERIEAAVADRMLQLLPTVGTDKNAGNQEIQGNPAQIPIALVVRYIAAAQVGFMQWWLENDMPLDPQTAAAHLLQLHMRGGGQILGISLGKQADPD